nr:16S rRNA (cytosine(1402)-N(4))-methyltransferase RsmH [Tardiphaga sp.]
MSENTLHTPVMLERTVELLAPAISRPGAVLVDATLGLGGHAEAFLERFPELTIVGIDRDPEALALTGQRLASYGARAVLVRAVYDAIPVALATLVITAVAGILFDLGVSSLQLDRVDRGFSYSQDAPLDMRMDSDSPLTAERIIAEYSEYDLRRIFYEFGEEKLAPRYASKIVQAREKSPISRSGQLVDVIVAATPAAAKRAGHPAKRVFQALRIEVNQELAVLARAIPAALDVLDVDGRMVVLAYQSLEDRIVKRVFAARSASTAPRGLPVELPEHRPELRLLVRGAELASDEEKQSNPRATPVRLRAVQKLRPAA